MCNKIKMLVFCSMMMLSLSSAQAIIINSSASLVSGNTWKVTYDFTNDVPNLTIDFVSIYYDFGLFENLVAVGSPDAWIVEVFDQVGSFFNNDGIVDFYLDDFVLGNPIEAGQSLGGFVVQFDFLGDPTEAFGVTAEVLAFDPSDPFGPPTILDTGMSTEQPLIVNNVSAPSIGIMVLVFLIGLLSSKQFMRFT